MKHILVAVLVCLTFWVSSSQADTYIGFNGVYTTSSGEVIRCAPLPTPAPEPTPIPVACTYVASPSSNLKAIADVLKPGDIVCLHGGVYTKTLYLSKSGTRDKPILITGFPGESKPIFDTNYSDSSVANIRVFGTYNILDGIESRHGKSGITLNRDNNTVRNSWIHDSHWFGIQVAASSGNTIEKNRIERNGDSTCTVPNCSPRHAHNIYISNPSGYCKNMTGNKILNNYLGESGGAAVNMNGQPCSGYYIDSTVIDGNTIVDSSMGVPVYYNIRNTAIRNNSFTIQTPPVSNLPVSMKAAILTWGVPASEPVMSNNTFNLKSDYVPLKRF